MQWVKLDYYRGSDKARLRKIEAFNSLASKVQAELERIWDALPPDGKRTVMYFEVAQAIHEPAEEVRKVFDMMGRGSGVIMDKRYAEAPQ
jgi:hypothetical protein